MLRREIRKPFCSPNHSQTSSRQTSTRFSSCYRLSGHWSQVQYPNGGLNSELNLVWYSWHLNIGPFGDQTFLDYLYSVLVRFSDQQFIKPFTNPSTFNFLLLNISGQLNGWQDVPGHVGLLQEDLQSWGILWHVQRVSCQYFAGKENLITLCNVC